MSRGCVCGGVFAPTPIPSECRREKRSTPSAGDSRPCPKGTVAGSAARDPGVVPPSGRGRGEGRMRTLQGTKVAPEELSEGLLAHLRRRARGAQVAGVSVPGPVPE